MAERAAALAASNLEAVDVGDAFDAGGDGSETAPSTWAQGQLRDAASAPGLKLVRGRVFDPVSLRATPLAFAPLCEMLAAGANTEAVLEWVTLTARPPLDVLELGRGFATFVARRGDALWLVLDVSAGELPHWHGYWFASRPGELAERWEAMSQCDPRTLSRKPIAKAQAYAKGERADAVHKALVGTLGYLLKPWTCVGRERDLDRDVLAIGRMGPLWAGLRRQLVGDPHPPGAGREKASPRAKKASSCRTCGKPLPPQLRSNAVSCSVSCRQAYSKRKRRHEQKHETTDRTAVPAGTTLGARGASEAMPDSDGIPALCVDDVPTDGELVEGGAVPSVAVPDGFWCYLAEKGIGPPSWRTELGLPPLSPDP